MLVVRCTLQQIYDLRRFCARRHQTSHLCCKYCANTKAYVEEPEQSLVVVGGDPGSGRVRPRF